MNTCLWFYGCSIFVPCWTKNFIFCHLSLPIPSLFNSVNDFIAVIVDCLLLINQPHLVKVNQFNKSFDQGILCFCTCTFFYLASSTFFFHFIEDLSPFFFTLLYIIFYYFFIKNIFAINEIPRIISKKNSSGNTYPHVTYPTHSFHNFIYHIFFLYFMMNSCSPPTQLIDRLVVVRFKIIKFN